MQILEEFEREPAGVLEAFSDFRFTTILSETTALLTKLLDLIFSN
jgi:hypothetical protein